MYVATKISKNLLVANMALRLVTNNNKKGCCFVKSGCKNKQIGCVGNKHKEKENSLNSVDLLLLAYE